MGPRTQKKPSPPEANLGKGTNTPSSIVNEKDRERRLRLPRRDPREDRPDSRGPDHVRDASVKDRLSVEEVGVRSGTVSEDRTGVPVSMTVSD